MWLWHGAPSAHGEPPRLAAGQDRPQCYHWPSRHSGRVRLDGTRMSERICVHTPRPSRSAWFSVAVIAGWLAHGRRLNAQASPRPQQPAPQQPPATPPPAASAAGPAPSSRRIRDRHQLRPRRRHRHRRQGQAGARPEAGRVHPHRGQQAPEDRAVHRRQDRCDRQQIASRPTARDPERLRRGARGGAARRAAVRPAARRLPRPARQRHGGPEAAASSSSRTSSPRPTWSRSCIRSRRSPICTSRRNRDATIRRHQRVRGPQVRLPAAQHVRGAVRLLPGQTRSSGSATRSTMGALKAAAVQLGACAKGGSRSSSSARASRRRCRRS